MFYNVYFRRSKFLVGPEGLHCCPAVLDAHARLARMRLGALIKVRTDARHQAGVSGTVVFASPDVANVAFRAGRCKDRAVLGVL